MAQACSEHPELAESIRARFRFLGEVGMADVDQAAEMPDRLGEFRLIRRLGGGGMGVVYLARQEPLDRDVALKLIRPEQLYFPGARQRFEREMRTVAALQHPGIVPIYTVGEENGVPYFAMERYQGATLAEVLSELRDRAPESLTRDDLLRAVATRFGQECESGVASALPESWVDACVTLVHGVAEALAHVHQQGVVHRDIKPSNIAIKLDGRSQLLDFGLTSSAGAEQMTRSGGTVGTLLYMAPERIRGGPQGSDARTDLYSLGVTLYELLTLQLPFRSDDPLRVQTLILEGRPDSIRARNRRVSVDLETVCLKAMDPEPGRRYTSAREFAGDLKNILELRPIQARPPGAWRRLRRFTQRNRGLSAALVLAFLLVTLLPTALYLQQRGHSAELRDAFDRLDIQFRTVNATLEFLRQVFGSLSPEQSAGEEVSVRELFEETARRADTDLTESPQAQASIRRILGEAFLKLGDPIRAVELLEACLPVYVEVGGARDIRVAAVESDLGSAYLELNQLEKAEPLLHRALQTTRDRLGDRHPETADRLVNVAMLHHRRGDLDQAEILLRQAVAAYREASEADGRGMAIALGTLGFLLGDRDVEDQEGIGLLREALEILDREFGEDDPEAAALLNQLAVLLKRAGRLEEAEPIQLRSVALNEKLFGKDSQRVGIALFNMARIREQLGRLGPAEEDFRRALTLIDRWFEDAPSTRIIAVTAFVDFLLAQGRNTEAALELQKAHQIAVREWGREGDEAMRLAARLQEVVERGGD